MKKKGDISHDYIYRDRVVLPDLIRRARRIVEYPTNAMKIYHVAAELPVRRFYISDDAAAAFIRSHVYKGVRPTFTSRYKQRLYDALFDEVSRMLCDSRYRDMDIGSVVSIALTHPAPCVGISPFVIMRTVSLIRKKNGKV